MKEKSKMAQLMEYAGNYRYLTYSSYVLSAISALVALTPFWCIWKILQEVISVAPNYNEAQNISHYGWMAVGLAVTAMFLYIASLWCSHLPAFRVQRNMRTRVMEHVVTLPVGFLSDWGTGRVRKIVNDCSANTETYLAHIWPDKAGTVFTPLGLVALLFVFDWRLGLLCLIPVAVAFAVMSTMMGKRMQESMKQYQTALETMTSETVEYVRGVPVVKTFGQTIFSFKKFKDSIDRYKVWVIAYTKQLRAPMMFYTAAINGVFAALIAGALIFTQGGVTKDFLLDLMFYIIITPIISVTLTRIMFQSENAMIVDDALQRIDSVLNLKPLAEPKQPEHPEDASVQLNHVHFSYDGKNEVIKDISLSIPAGQTVAFVGPSGGGKTTLANLICRFFDPQGGQVKIGSVDVKHIAKEELMNTVSFVFQNSRLIKASILENVRMGKPDATREEIMAALHNAQCDDILEKLPQGADTVIGTKGVYLSGGEQQRIAIARVMLKNSPVVILDEATAFADPDNESRVQAAFSKLSQGKTVIMIAHRLSTVAGVDQIYVIEGGQITESGKSRELLEKGGVFSHMWQDYQTSVQWKVAKEVQ